MRCENCGSKLNPLMLKQAEYVGNVLTFEVECMVCRSYNYLSKKAYFLMKKDYDMPIMKPINLKLPSDLNVAIVSMQRCGISWVVRELNMLHERIFGESIKFFPEVSFVEATRTRFPVIKGWIWVFDVNPLDLLRTKDNGEKYDRVLIVKRKLKTIMTVHEIYYPEDLSEDQKVKWRAKDEKIYDKVYNQEINDPRCMTVNLEDLNNYTVNTFNELMDFLNYPEYERPIIAPILAPERNSEAYSSILTKGQPLIKRLETIASFYEVTLDGLLQLKTERKRLREHGIKQIKLKNILVIGPGFYKGCHFSENIYYAFEEKGYNVNLLALQDLGYGTFEGKPYNEHREIYPLSKAVAKLEDPPDLIIMDEPSWYFNNDVEIPVFYIQREYKRPPKCFYPDIAFFWHSGIIRYFQKFFAPHWARHTTQLETIGIAVVPEHFKKRRKRIHKGIVALAGRESMVALATMKELTGLGALYDIKHQVQKARELGIKFIGYENETLYDDKYGGTLNDEQYRDVLPKCEGIWIHVPLGQFVSRRMVEAMACKVVCAIRIENEDHEWVLREMGLLPNEHYIPITDVSDVAKINKVFKYKEYKTMVNKAYKVVMEKHTYQNKADELIKHYNDWAFRLRGVVIQ